MIRQFLGYSVVGTLAFSADLGLLYVFYSFIGMPYVVAVPLAFIIATSGHYFLARRFVFSETTRPPWQGYFFFLAIMVTNAAVVTTLVYGLVEFEGTNLYLARIAVAVLIGVLSFFLNARYNFRTL